MSETRGMTILGLREANDADVDCVISFVPEKCCLPISLPIRRKMELPCQS